MQAKEKKLAAMKTMKTSGKRIKFRLNKEQKLIMLKIIITGLVDQVLFRKKIFNKNLVAIHEIKPVLTLDKSIYVGFIIPIQPNF